MAGLTDLVTVSNRKSYNSGLSYTSNTYLIGLLGKPRESMTADCSQVTNPLLKGLLVTENVGPFRVTGLKPAVDSLRNIMSDISREQPDAYKALGSAGMLCCRLVRGSSSSISNHAWGTAIDLTLNGKLDSYKDGKTQHGLTLIAPIFKKHGWCWGVAFDREDSMHFEVSKGKMEEWKASGSFGKPSRTNNTVTGSTASSVTSGGTLRKGDKGPEVLALQKKLASLGYFDISKAANNFGPLTEQAVKAFQLKKGLVVDGVVGPKTRKALGM